MRVNSEITSTALTLEATLTRSATRNARGERHVRSDGLRAALGERLCELHAQRSEALAGLGTSGTVDAGDDVADLGTKAFTREQEIALASSIQIQIGQVERALQRLEEGRYGLCERCSREIPVDRLAAYPSATLCIACKQLEERH